MNQEDHAPDPRRGLPSISEVLAHPALREAARHETIVRAARRVLDACRHRPGDGMPSVDEIVNEVRDILRADAGARLRPAINATGILLHTGLGRAVLPGGAVEALAELRRCCNLQIDLDTGRARKTQLHDRTPARPPDRRRGGPGREQQCRRHPARPHRVSARIVKSSSRADSSSRSAAPTGCPTASTRAAPSFVEVGTTNKTHLRDYERGRDRATRRRHPARQPQQLPDRGLRQRVLDPETGRAQTRPRPAPDRRPRVRRPGRSRTVRSARTNPPCRTAWPPGPTWSCFSGDKLIGGPQAGIIVGRETLVKRSRKHPLTRMLRVGKLTDLALQQTLRLFLSPETLARNDIPCTAC